MEAEAKHEESMEGWKGASCSDGRLEHQKYVHQDPYSLLALPHEVLLHLMAVLPVADLGRLGQTCRLLHALSRENLVWHSQAEARWPGVLGKPSLNWRRYYLHKLLLHEAGALEWNKIDREEGAVQRCAHTGCVVNGKIYYIGGQDTRDRRLGEIQRYDPQKNEWVQLHVPGVPNFARHQAATVGNRIFCFGGYDLRQFYALAMFSPDTNEWSYPETTGDLPRPRSNHASAVLGNRFFIFGGSVGDNVNLYETVDDFYYCDIETLRWTKIKSTNTPSRRVGHKMIGLRGKIYLFGGGVWSSAQGWVEQYNETWTYDPERNEWSEVKTKLAPPVSTYAYIFTFGTHIAIYGGASLTGNSVEKRLWMFDTVTQTWAKMNVAGAEPSPRSMGTSDWVGDSVYLWGGYCGGVVHFTQDFYRLKVSNPVLFAVANTVWND